MLRRPDLKARPSYDLVKTNGGAHKSETEIAKGDFAPAFRPGYLNDRIVSSGDRDEFGRRIEMAEGAAERSAIARLAMSDVQDRFMHQGHPARNIRVKFEGALPGHSADTHSIFVSNDT